MINNNISKNDYIDFLKKLIAIQSVTGNEKEAAEFLKKNFIENGFENCFIDRCGNLVALLPGRGEGPCIMLNGHLDVVPEGNMDDWLPYHPYNAELDDEGNLYGRGTSDMKGGLSSLFFTMLHFKKLSDEGFTLPGNLVFSAVVHEEAAEMLGMEYLIEKTLPEIGIKCDLVCLAEPTDGNLAIGQRGKVELVIRTKGKTAHSSVPKEGINALEKMGPVLDYIFKTMPLSLKSSDVFGEGTVTVTDCVVKPGALSVIPDECEISVDRRYMPDETIESLLEEFENLFKGLKEKDSDFDASVSARYFDETTYTGYSKNIMKYHPPWMMERDNIFVEKAFAALKKAGQNPSIKYWKSGCDGSMSCGIHGIPTIGYSWGLEEWVHKPGERVNIDRMLETISGYIEIVKNVMDADESFSIWKNGRSGI